MSPTTILRSVRRFLLIAFIILSGGYNYSQEFIHLFSTEPSDIAPDQWMGKWIWLPGVPDSETNVVMLARNTFAVEEIPAEAIIYITATDHYKLWVNGTFVSRGPARCNQHHQSYDVIDISPGLKRGDNVIAVQTHYRGIIGSYYSDPRPGLLVQLDLGDGDDARFIVSDRTWKVLRDPAWDSRTESVNVHQGNTFFTSYNFPMAQKDWQQINYNDSGWGTAVYQIPGGWPPKERGYVPYAIQDPWLSLVARDIPPLREYDQQVFRVFKVSEAPQFSKSFFGGTGIRQFNALHNSIQDYQQPLNKSKVMNLENFLQGNSNLIIENSYPNEKFIKEPIYNTTIVFDFEKIAHGYPYIRLKGKAGGIIDVNYAPYLIDNAFIPSILENNFADRFILSGGTDFWECMEQRSFRYMSITVRGPDPVEVEKIGFRSQEYPFEEQGEIQVDNEPFIANIWKATENTIRVITTDAYTDNYQEKRQYVQTSYYASIGNYATFSDPYLQRRYLVQHAQDQLPNGIMPMWAPWNIYFRKSFPGIFEANHFWLMGLHDYYQYTGDEKTVRELLVSAERCANAINQLQFKDDLLYKVPYPYWIDHAKLAQGDMNFTINALQSMAFSNYARLLEWLGHDDQADKWYAEADKIVNSLRLFWNDEKGLYADNRNGGKNDNNFSEHANSLAIVSGVATGKQVISIVDKLINNDTHRLMEEAVLFNYWPVEALFSTGNGKEAVEFMKKRYKYMLEDEEVNQTLWENVNLYARNIGPRISSAPDEWQPRSYSVAQAENCFPASSISRWILGIHPFLPGIQEVIITSFSSPYQSFSGKFPTPRGVIQVKRNEDKLSLNLPSGVTARITVSEIDQLNPLKIIINDKIYERSDITEDLIIASGENRIQIL